MDRRQFVFFVGSHRTGSKSLAHFFHDFVPNTRSTHQRRAHQWLNLFAGMSASGVLPEPVYEAAVRRLLVSWLEGQPSERVVETNGFNFMALKTVVALYPATKIVHVVRDPRDFITSMVNFRRRKPLRRIVQLHLPFWDYGPRGVSEPRKLAWQWSYKNRFIEESYSEHPLYTRVRFEDLFDPESETFGEMLRFIDPELNPEHLGKSFFRRRLNAAGKGTFPAWREWDGVLCRQVEEECGPLMRKYGYGQEQPWRARLSGG